jgi:hypothetical protein
VIFSDIDNTVVKADDIKKQDVIDKKYRSINAFVGQVGSR